MASRSRIDRKRLVKAIRRLPGLAGLLLIALLLCGSAVVSLFTDVPWVTNHEGALTLALVAAVVVTVIFERGVILEDLRSGVETVVRALPPGQVELLDTPDDAYERAGKLLGQLAPNSNVQMATFFGHKGERGERKPYQSSSLEAFMQSVDACARNGRIKRLVGVSDSHRFDHLVGELDHMKTADDYDVKAVAEPSIDALSPLIIGDEDLLLAQDDGSHYRVASAIHLHGRTYVEWALEYFDELWNDSRNHHVRNKRGVDPDALRTLAKDLQIDDESVRTALQSLQD